MKFANSWRKQGLEAARASIQTYSISSGATQSRVTVPVRTSDGRDCGSLHVIGAADGDARMILDVDDRWSPPEALSALQVRHRLHARTLRSQVVAHRSLPRSVPESPASRPTTALLRARRPCSGPCMRTIVEIPGGRCPPNRQCLGDVAHPLLHDSHVQPHQLADLRGAFRRTGQHLHRASASAVRVHTTFVTAEVTVDS